MCALRQKQQLGRQEGFSEQRKECICCRFWSKVGCTAVTPHLHPPISLSDVYLTSFHWSKLCEKVKVCLLDVQSHISLLLWGKQAHLTDRWFTHHLEFPHRVKKKLFMLQLPQWNLESVSVSNSCCLTYSHSRHRRLSNIAPTILLNALHIYRSCAAFSRPPIYTFTISSHSLTFTQRLGDCCHARCCQSNWEQFRVQLAKETTAFAASGFQPPTFQ